MDMFHSRYDDPIGLRIWKEFWKKKIKKAVTVKVDSYYITSECMAGLCRDKDCPYCEDKR